MKGHYEKLHRRDLKIAVGALGLSLILALIWPKGAESNSGVVIQAQTAPVSLLSLNDISVNRKEPKILGLYPNLDECAKILRAFVALSEGEAPTGRVKLRCEQATTYVR